MEEDEAKKQHDKEIKKLTFVAAIGGSCIGGSATLVFPFLPLYLYQLGADKSNVALWTALVTSGMFIMGALIMPIWGGLADRYGKKKMILRSAFCLSLAYFLQYFVQSPFQLFLARLFQGFSFGYFPVFQALLSEAAGSHAGSAIGILFGGRSAGAMLGPFLGGLLGTVHGLRFPFLISGIIDIGAFLLVLFWVKEPKKEKKKVQKKKGLIASFKLLCHNHAFIRLQKLMIINQCALLLIEPLVAVHIVDLTGDIAGATFTSGLICGAAGIASALAGPWWGRLGDRWGYYHTMGLSFLGAGIFSAFQFLAPTVLTFGIAMFGFGAFTICGMTSISSDVAVVTSDEERGSAFGINAASMNIGNFFGPLLGGMLATIFHGMAVVFIFAAIVQIGSAAFIYTLIRKADQQKNMKERQL
jgi:DHA1 family multidrug resistance protein-like MFS transporter